MSLQCLLGFHDPVWSRRENEFFADFGMTKYADVPCGRCGRWLFMSHRDGNWFCSLAVIRGRRWTVSAWACKHGYWRWDCPWCDQETRLEAAARSLNDDMRRFVEEQTGRTPPSQVAADTEGGKR